MITIENIKNHELIGTNTLVVQSLNSQIIGINGKIIDETKSMFTLQTKKGIKQIPKGISQWGFELDGKQTTIDGKSLLRRSFERVGVKK